MNFSSAPMQFEEAVKIANKILSAKNPKFKIITGILIQSKYRIYLYFCYYYLRWVDDFIDNKDNPINEKAEFLENQFKLVSSIASGNDYQLNFNEEYFIHFYINFAKSTGRTILIEVIFVLLETIRQDVERLKNDGIFSEAELQKYLNGHAEILYKTLNTFLMPGKKLKYINKFTVLYTFMNLLWLRDIYDDSKVGYINISREDIAKYKLNVHDLFNNDTYAEWFSDKTSSLLKMQQKEAEEMRELPFKLKIFWFCSFPYSYRRIYRIRTYNYNYHSIKRKNLLLEFKINFMTVISCVRFFAKIFL